MNDDNLSLIKEEVYKCSKCGLCQSVCPLYLATKNEMYLSRGRYNVLNNFFNNRKNLSSKFIKDIDICLNCNECKNFCPSSIDAEAVFTQIKHKFNYKYGIIPFSVSYFINLHLHKIKKIFSKDKLYKVKVRRKKHKFQQNNKKIVYFEGCFNKYINPSDKNSSLNIMEKLGFQIININSCCCGLPFYSEGNLKAFKINADKIIKSIPVNADYIICSCDSCYATLKKAFKNNSISEKLLRLEDLLRLNNYQLPVCSNTVVHRTLGRKEEYYLPLNIKTINKKGSCSLMENFFMLKYKELYKILLKSVFYKKAEIDNKTIITTCQLSKQGIAKGIDYIGSNANIVSYSEYIEINS